MMNVRREFYTARSPAGTATPAYVDIPTPEGGKIVIVTRIQAHIRSKNGRKSLGSKEIGVSRFEAGVDGADRDTATPFSEFTIPISGPKRNGDIFYAENNDPYTSIIGKSAISNRGFRVELSDKDRPSDDQYLSIAVETLTEDNLS